MSLSSLPKVKKLGNVELFFEGEAELLSILPQSKRYRRGKKKVNNPISPKVVDSFDNEGLMNLYVGILKSNKHAYQAAYMRYIRTTNENKRRKSTSDMCFEIACLENNILLQNVIEGYSTEEITRAWEKEAREYYAKVKKTTVEKLYQKGVFHD